jgi:predicted metalloendopeptidase
MIPKANDDFFDFVNNEWLEINPIPQDESVWGSFYVLRYEVEQQLKVLLEEISIKNDLQSGSDAQRVRDFYREAMDVAKRNRLGLSPLENLLKDIDVIKDARGLIRVVGRLHRLGIGVFWNPFVEQDEKNSALHLWQGGLGLPDRDYYLNEDEKSKKIRADYVEYATDMVLHANLANDAAESVAMIVDIETRLAKASLTRVELRDVEKQYNKMLVSDLAILAPGLALPEYFEALGLAAAPDYFIVGQPKFLGEVDRIISETSLDALKMYVRWQLLNSFTSYLSEDLELRSFNFYAKTFSGAKEMKPLWRRALKATDSALDEMLGKLYVERHFSEDAKKKINDLVEHLTMAYRARIERLDWMSEDTKKKALGKLATITRKLGYPDVWKDFSGLEIGTDSYVDNAINAQRFEFDRKMKQVGGAVIRTEWLMSPQTVNAYYMPPMNDIVFPAAILQAPFFDPNADDATNFGGIGTVIGHELTHGFDDQGSRFDEKGNLNEWWTSEDKERFEKKTAQMVQQFDAFEVLPGAHVNGKLTLGENIADLGGLLIAFDALKIRLGEKAESENDPNFKINGLTPEQRFFMNYAVTERGKSRDEIARLRLQVDPHSPSKFRVNGPLSNIPAFYEAFDVKEGDKMWRKPEDRVNIW